MKRTNLVLAAVAASLFAFIVFYEKDTLSSGELEETRNQLLPRFVRARVDQMVIEREGERLEIVREREDPEDLLGTWRMSAPIDALADDDAVGSALSAVQYASARRTLEDVSEEDASRYGLTEPRLRASFTIANESTEIRFGADDPTASGVYMQVGAAVHVVGRDVFEALDHPYGHFRSKRVLEEGVLLADRVELSGEGGARTLSLEDGGWRVAEAEGSTLAASPRVEEILQTVNDLVAARFVEGELGDAWLTAALHVPSEEGDARDVRLQIGGACPEHQDERLARVDEGPLTCVLTSRLDALLRPLADLRELRPITRSDLELEELRLETAGTTLTVAQPEGSWQWTLDRRGRTQSGAADDDALADWLQSIRRARADAVVPSADLRAHGLDPAAGTLTIRTSDEATEVLHIGSVSAEGLYLRRGDEPVVLIVPSDAEALLTPNASRLRARRILDEASRAVTRLAISRDGIVERLEDQDGGWQIKAPIAAPATPDTRELARTLARLQAERFVADEAGPEHGFGQSLSVAIHLEPEEGDPRDVTLEFGSAAEGGVFARLQGDPAVFVVSESLVDSLRSPRVDRGLLRSEVLYLERLTVEVEGRRAELTHDGSRFVGSDGPLDGETSEAIAGALERLRMEGATRYGPATVAEGLVPPRAQIEVVRDAEGEESRFTIWIGAPTGERNDVYVRRADLDVTFTIDEDRIAPILRVP
ncbi:MAG: DUF4340 domain-containing protein [Myxococcota bacterium]